MLGTILAMPCYRFAGNSVLPCDCVGSSLKYCRIAEGLADAYPKFASIWFWDTAAAQCVLEQAGGAALSLLDFAPMRYAPDSSLRTPSFFATGDTTRDWRALLTP